VRNRPSGNTLLLMNYRGMVNHNSSAVAAKARLEGFLSEGRANCTTDTRRPRDFVRKTQSTSLTRFAPLCSLTGTTGAIAMTSQVSDADDFDLRVETTTIMFADVVESVQLIEVDEAVNVRRIRALIAMICDELANAYGASILERRGDGILAIFSSATKALQAARWTHEVANHENLNEKQSILLRIGLHTANVLVGDGTVYGKGVNTAARVMTLANPGETAFTAEVRDLLVDDLDCAFEDLGDCFVKNATKPMRVYRAMSLNDKQTTHPSAVQSARAIIPLIAISPLATLGGDSASRAVGHYVAESLTSLLAKSSSVRVVSRFAIASGQDVAGSLPRMASLVHADYLVSGSCESLGSKSSIYVELADTKGAHVVWADRFFLDRNSLFVEGNIELIEQIAEFIQAQIIEAQLLGVAVKPLPSLQSYTLYIGGLSLMHRQSRDDFVRSKELFEYLKERYPRSAVPRAWISKWYMLNVVQGWTVDLGNDARLAHVEASRALEIEPKSSLCSTVRGVVFSSLERDFF
jgi:adenylate cyclase